MYGNCQMAAPPLLEPRRCRRRCDTDNLTCKLVGLTSFLGFIVANIIVTLTTLSTLKDEHYAPPEFNLKSLNPSQPYIMPSGDRLVSAGWEACFYSRNPNPKPIKYYIVHATLWAREGQTWPSDKAHVSPFEQPPGGNETRVCAGFWEDSVVKVVDKTVRFDAIMLHANVTYESADSVVRVVCEDVRVFLGAGDGNGSAAELDGGAGEKGCVVERHSPSDNLVLFVLMVIFVTVFVGFLVRYVVTSFFPSL